MKNILKVHLVMFFYWV